MRGYHSKEENKKKAREKHDRWREKCLAEGGDKALRWYFTRQMSTYRARTPESCDIDPDFLVLLYHKQNGLCYYTGQPLEWDSYGKRVPTKNSLSVDRLDPEKGYNKSNVVLCTYAVNTTKGHHTETQFYDFCQSVLTRASDRGLHLPLKQLTFRPD